MNLRTIVAVVCALVYALPLFAPPSPASAIVPPDAGWLARLYPGVPARWVGWRLLALAVAVLAWGGAHGRLRSESPPPPPGPGVPVARRMIALAIATALAAVSVFARGFGPLQQMAFLVVLAVPPLLLTHPRSGGDRAGSRTDVVSTAIVIGTWVVLRFITDLTGERWADVVDGWRGIVDLVRFVEQRHNVLTDLIDPELPGLGALPFALHGVPAFQAGWLTPSLRTIEILQIITSALTAAGIAVLARQLVGPGVAPTASAAFLFAPYVRFATLFPGPYVAGPLYATAGGLCVVAAVRHRSEAALAALGIVAGAALTHPGAVPIGGILVLFTAWRLWPERTQMAPAALVGTALFASLVIPGLSEVLTPERLGRHFALHGTVGLLEPALLGQTSVYDFVAARAAIAWRPLDIIVGALLEPFANPRTAIRLWGDAILDPATALLVALGLGLALRHAEHAPWARVSLGAYLAVLLPAFISPVDRVDIVHAVAFPVAAALWAAVGTASLIARFPGAASVLPIALAGLIGLGGSILFDVVTPRVVSPSAMGVLARALGPADTSRVVVLDYPAEFSPDTRWLFTGVMTRYASSSPIGYVRVTGTPLPLRDFDADGIDLLAWSPGLEADLGIRARVCALRPGAIVIEVTGPYGLGRTLVARLGAAPWVVRDARLGVTERPC